MLWAKQTFFLAPWLATLGLYNNVAKHKSSSKNARKLNLQPILNKKSPWVHMESDFEVLGIAIKLAKYVIHLSK
jgi:hypothetical protein